ncbi:hypothetical protein [Candidatus Spongiihabitans sp.]|uniref:hypothetical protein n=1 Tax=Candidatus Spongiihabitans sp. TaxID=3101308 RepID=UPI003C7C9C3E
MKTANQKFQTVMEKNTFYFSNPIFEQNYEGYLTSIKETLLVIKNTVENEGLKKEIFEDLLLEKEYGLRALLALTGLSNETLKRLITISRIVDDPELDKLILKSAWHEKDNTKNLKEWSDSKISSMILTNTSFRKGIVNIFFEGSSIPFLARTIPLFELKKLSISKLRFELGEMIDTLIRYKEKGSYSATGENNPETLIANILETLCVPFQKGELGELVENAPDNKRTMDFIIPNKESPLVIIESSFLVTTSSGQGDKSKTEISINSLLKEHYPRAQFIGFVDGIGWYVRPGDLQRMVNAYEDVFTFHEEELMRFEQLINSIFNGQPQC